MLFEGQGDGESKGVSRSPYRGLLAAYLKLVPPGTVVSLLLMWWAAAVHEDVSGVRDRQGIQVLAAPVYRQALPSHQRFHM